MSVDDLAHVLARLLALIHIVDDDTIRKLLDFMECRNLIRIDRIILDRLRPLVNDGHRRIILKWIHLIDLGNLDSLAYLRHILSANLHSSGTEPSSPSELHGRVVELVEMVEDFLLLLCYGILKGLPWNIGTILLRYLINASLGPLVKPFGDGCTVVIRETEHDVIKFSSISVLSVSSLLIPIDNGHPFLECLLVHLSLLRLTSCLAYELIDLAVSKDPVDLHCACDDPWIGSRVRVGPVCV